MAFNSQKSVISSIEALASQIYTDYSPSNDAVVNSKRSVYDLAIKLGLTKDEATEMALEASKGISWSRKKFEKFIIDYLPESFFEKDDLFEIDNKLLPEKIDFENTIKLIYSARSKLTHRGSGFPPSAELGIGPKISLRTIMSFDWQSKPFPPIVWFERLVPYFCANTEGFYFLMLFHPHMWGDSGPEIAMSSLKSISAENCFRLRLVLNLISACWSLFFSNALDLVES